MPERSLIDNWNFLLFGHGTKYPFKGYISSIDPTTAGVGVLIGGSQNTHKTLLGTIKVRDGLKRRGTANSTIAGVTSSFEWYTSLGAVLPVRVTEENKLQVESDIADGSTLVWYDLMTSLDSTRFVFDTWWDDTNKKDILIFVKFDNNTYAWNGGIAKFVSGIANTSITLDRDAVDAGFAPTGNVIINGVTYPYTGISGVTLTGVTGDPSGVTVGSIALSGVITNSNSPTGASDNFTNDFIKVVNNQLHVGSYNSRLIYVSAFDDYNNFSVPPSRALGDPDLLTLNSQTRGITVQKGSTDSSGNAVISGGLGDWYTIVRTQATVGTDLLEQVDVIQTQTADLSTALAHEFIETIGENIIFLDQNNQMREFGIVRNIINPVFPLLSLDVYTEFKNRDFTGGHIRVVADENDTTIYITCPNAGIDYMYQIRQKIDDVGNLTAERLWNPPQVRGISRIAVIDGVTYGHSNANPQIYQLWNTNQFSDDSPSDTPVPYECHAIFAYISLENPTQQLIFDKVYFEGYMTQGTNLYNNIYQEYQGSKNILTQTVNHSTKPGQRLAKFYSSGNDAPSLGDISLGLIPLGEGISGNTDTNNPPKFRAIRDAQPADIFEFALDLFSFDLDSNWQILRLGPNIMATTRRPVAIR